MGKAGLTYREIRFTGLDTEMTHCFVLIDAHGDCPLGVQGWHYKAFPASMTVAEVLAAAFSGEDNPVMWPQAAPESLRYYGRQAQEEGRSKSFPPWTDAEVANLARRQAAEHLHPYTCENGHELVPQRGGWTCPECAYRQTWCWRSDAEGRWPEGFPTGKGGPDE